MLLTNPQSKARVFYLLSVFLALVLLPFCMGTLMALHPEGAWTTDSVPDPLSHRHPLSYVLWVFHGCGFAFFFQEAWFRYGWIHSRTTRILAWIWGAGVAVLLIVLLRDPNVRNFFYQPSLSASSSSLLGTLLVWGAVPFLVALGQVALFSFTARRP